MSSPCLFGEDIHDILCIGDEEGKEVAECGYCNKKWEVVRHKEGSIELIEMKEDGKKI